MKTKEIEQETEKRKITKYAQKDILLSYMPYLIIIFFVFIIRLLVVTPVKVNGSSMNPTLKNNDYMLLYKLTKKMRGIKRFDIVVIKTDSGRLIKRVIGLPGDTLKYEIEENDDGKKSGVLYVNGKKIEEKFLDEDAKKNTCNEDWIICETEYIVPENEYFVMGDNRGNSIDSRKIGTIEYKNIEGTTKLIFFPFSRFGNVD